MSKNMNIPDETQLKSTIYPYIFAAIFCGLFIAIIVTTSLGQNKTTTKTPAKTTVTQPAAKTKAKSTGKAPAQKTPAKATTKTKTTAPAKQAAKSPAKTTPQPAKVKPAAKSTSKPKPQPKPAAKTPAKTATKTTPKTAPAKAATKTKTTAPAKKPAKSPAKTAANAAKAKTTKTAPTKKTTKVIRASLNYPDLDPVQLFQILSNTFQVQFEGVKTVTGPISLITKEDQPVDLNGMIKLLNDVLAKQNKEARLKGQIIQIVSVKDIMDATIPLKYAKPDEVKTILETRFMKQPGGENSDKSRQPSFIEPHPQGHAIILRAPKSVVEEITKYVKDQLDIPPITEGKSSSTTEQSVEPITKAFTLKYVKPDEILPFLTDLYLVKPGMTAKEKAHKASVITKHPKYPVIVVEGPPKVVADIGAEIAKLDIKPLQPPQPPLKREYITLDYIDSIEFKQLIDEDESIKDKFISVLAPNNTLIISSDDDKVFAKIKEIKKTFDIDRMEIRYIPLSNAKAADIAKLIQSIYPKEAATPLPEQIQRLRREQLSGSTSFTSVEDYSMNLARKALEEAGVNDPGILDRLSRSISVIQISELNIIPDPERNGLLVRTFSRNFPRLLELINELDQPRKQVFIEVFITQVSRDDKLELGFDYNYFGDIERKGETIPYTLTQDMKTKTRVTKSSLPTGLNYEIISDNITAFMHALEISGKVDIISRPHLVTKDNSKATVTVGNIIPFLSKVTVSAEGLAGASTVIYKDVGTKLEVTPQVHPDDYVTLKINQEINEISAETFQISRDFNPQIIVKRAATTELRVKDGQTICIAGFVGDNIITNENKIPLLGDIPYLGELFKYSERKRVKSELIIFMTPHILSTPQEILRMTNAMRKTSHAERRKDRGTIPLDTEKDLRYPPYRDPLLDSMDLEKLDKNSNLEPLPDSTMPNK